MKVLNFGSLNIDHVYNMPHFTEPKETQSSLSYMRNLGGKGLNQSIALAKAGAETYHAGRIGADGEVFRTYLESYGVHTDWLETDEHSVTGHAIIETCEGENRIILYGGANQEIGKELIDRVLEHFSAGDVLLVQNEISGMAYLLNKAHGKGMQIVFNTAPMNEKVFSYPLDCVDTFIVNEVEGRALAESEAYDPSMIIEDLRRKYPGKELILTAGTDGAWYSAGEEFFHQDAFPVIAVDTTAAGDTFTGYFLAMKLLGKTPQEAMATAARASSMTVQKAGAAQSIPSLEELL
ncbi:MAG: ribokinase [Solobacterium sp.]|nr:ribokinase [Solobacterium sp.]